MVFVVTAALRRDLYGIRCSAPRFAQRSGYKFSPEIVRLAADELLVR